MEACPIEPQAGRLKQVVWPESSFTYGTDMVVNGGPILGSLHKGSYHFGVCASKLSHAKIAYDCDLDWLRSLLTACGSIPKGTSLT